MTTGDTLPGTDDNYSVIQVYLDFLSGCVFVVNSPELHPLMFLESLRFAVNSGFRSGGMDL